MITNKKNLSAVAFLRVCTTATQFVKIRGIRVTGFSILLLHRTVFNPGLNHENQNPDRRR